MKLILNTGAAPDFGTVNLPNDLLWQDEFSWSPVELATSYSLTGALIVESSTKLAGRPITLGSQSDMAWVPRSTVESLRVWAALSGRVFTLEFEYPTDVRTFLVAFDNTGQGAVDASPVKGFPEHATDSWFNLSLRFFQV